jgi:hypothetical protein
VLVKLNFKGKIIHWKGPAPFYFIVIPETHSKQIKKISAQLSYGWGIVPVIGKIKELEFSTALIPKDGLYYLPVKNAVRLPLSLEPGAEVRVELTLGD